MSYIKVIKYNWLWLVFAVFVIAAIYFHDGEPLFISDGPYGFGKTLFWLLFGSFLSYSIYCSTQENFFKTLRVFQKLHWGRQIGLDLYIGIFIMSGLIFFNEGNLLALLFWVGPLIVFANLATLLYLALNYDSLIGHFLA